MRRAMPESVKRELDELRSARIDRGLCRQCGEPVEANTMLCAKHRARENMRSREAQRRRHGYAATRNTCGECSESGHNIRTCPRASS